MSNIVTGERQIPSGTIVRDRWVRSHPGRPRTPKAHRTFRVPLAPVIARSMKEALESMSEYWIPGRAPDPTDASETLVANIRRDVRTLDPGLRIGWNPKNRLWGVWIASEAIKTDYCRGWKLLFQVKPGFLDYRVMSHLYESDTTRFGGGLKYYNAFVQAQADDAVKFDDESACRARTWAGEYFNFTRVKCFMPSVKPKGYGLIQQGGKFAKHG